MPFEYYGGEHSITNSEKQFKCWFLRDPANKEAKNKKKIQFRLPAGGHQEITVSLRSPTDKLNEKMVSQIQIISHNAVASESRHSPPGFPSSEEERIEFLAVGLLDNPRIKCLKQLYHKVSNTQMISFAVKKTDEV